MNSSKKLTLHKILSTSKHFKKYKHSKKVKKIFYRAFLRMDSFDSVSLTAINTSNTDKKHVVDIVDLNVQEIRPKFPLFKRKKIFRDCVLTFIKVLHNKFLSKLIFTFGCDTKIFFEYTPITICHFWQLFLRPMALFVS